MKSDNTDSFGNPAAPIHKLGARVIVSREETRP